MRKIRKEMLREFFPPKKDEDDRLVLDKQMAALENAFAGKEDITAIDILGSKDVYIGYLMYIVLREEFLSENAAQEFCLRCAEYALLRSGCISQVHLDIIDGKRDWMCGNISNQELDSRHERLCREIEKKPLSDDIKAMLEGSSTAQYCAGVRIRQIEAAESILFRASARKFLYGPYSLARQIAEDTEYASMSEYAWTHIRHIFLAVLDEYNQKECSYSDNE